MSSTIYSQDVERQVDLGVQTHQQESKNIPSLQERAGQGCFLYLESHDQGQYAILVPCLRPTEAIPVVKRRGDRLYYRKRTEEDTMPWNSACESDEEIYRRLVDTWYQYLGWWKRWLPYYGISEVLEVNFRFAGSVEPDGRYAIYMNPINLKNALEECEKKIARHPTNPSFDFDDICSGNNVHSEECEIIQGWGQRCIKIQAEKAEQCRKRLLSPPLLKKCARNPASANGLHTLEVSGKEGYIYDIKGPKQVKLPLPYQRFQETTTRMRGMHFILGWQTDRMQRELPFKVSFAWLGIASTWLTLVVWRGVGGDWGTAFAFAQVVAASVAIIVTCVQS